MAQAPTKWWSSGQRPVHNQKKIEDQDVNNSNAKANAAQEHLGRFLFIDAVEKEEKWH